MNTTINVNKLANWINCLLKKASADESFAISWFDDTKDLPFSIVGGWMSGFSEEYSDLLCVSKSNPEYAMCIKIAVNEGPYAYTDFEVMCMPENDNGEVDDTCVALEQDDDAESMAMFLAMEYDRICKEYGKL